MKKTWNINKNINWWWRSKIYKIDKTGNPILIDKKAHWWKYFIYGKEIQTLIDKDSMRILEGSINFIEDSIARKNNF
jgi:hypothetical protein